MTLDAPHSDCLSPNRQCSGCGETKPIEEFRRKRRDSDRRETRCRARHARYMRWYCRSRREKALVGFAREAKWRSDTEHLAALVQALTARFGGMDEFVRSFVRLYRELASDPRCSKQAADGYLAMIRLLQTVAKEQKSS